MRHQSLWQSLEHSFEGSNNWENALLCNTGLIVLLLQSDTPIQFQYVAGVHAGVGGVSAMAKAEVCRAEASVPGIAVGVGLNVNTGAQVGPTGAELKILGFGFSVGLKTGISTPFGDIRFG